jgi:acyl transferase domain-containing protein
LDTRLLTGSIGFHSPLIDPVLAAFSRETDVLQCAEPRIPIISNHTGKVAQSGEFVSGNYWVHQLREPVRFGKGTSNSRGPWRQFVHRDWSASDLAGNPGASIA